VSGWVDEWFVCMDVHMCAGVGEWVGALADTDSKNPVELVGWSVELSTA